MSDITLYLPYVFARRESSTHNENLGRSKAFPITGRRGGPGGSLSGLRLTRLRYPSKSQKMAEIVKAAIK